MTTLLSDKASLSNVAYQEIRDRILIGEFVPGDKLVIDDLVGLWNISNTPIKEALNRLLAEGLVEALPRRGMRVRRYSIKEMREIIEIRMMHEAYCCRVAVERVDRYPHMVEALWATLEKAAEALAMPDSDIEQLKLDEIFHVLIVGMCGNDTLRKIYEHIVAIIMMAGISQASKQRFRDHAVAYEAHRRILQALVDRRGDDMVGAMRKHLRQAADDFFKFYRRH